MSAYMQLYRVLPKNSRAKDSEEYKVYYLIRCGKAYKRLSNKVINFARSVETKLNKSVVYMNEGEYFANKYYCFKVQKIIYRQGWYFKHSFLNSEAMTRIFTDIKEAYYGLPKIMDLNKHRWYYNNALEAYRSILNTWEELDKKHPGEYFLEVVF